MNYIGTTVELGAELQFPYTGTISMIPMLLIQPEESVDVTIVHVEEHIKATQNLLYFSVHNNYYTDVFILKMTLTEQIKYQKLTSFRTEETFY